MATYAIGDVQGCFDELQALLKKINFNETKDQLWFVGDIVNRGPQSLQVLRFVKNLPQAKVVLGNHDLHLISLAYGFSYPHHTLQDVLTAPDCEQLVNWLRHLPLLHYDAQLDYVMVHAGLLPQWDLAQAQQYARELEIALQSQQLPELLKHLYGDQPDQWSEKLSGWERLRFITNVFTRIRFCDTEERLEFKSTGKIGSQPAGYLPWFKIPKRRNKNLNIIFGHWSALRGEADEAGVFALDTGCAWNGSLTAMRLEDQRRFSVACRSSTTKL